MTVNDEKRDKLIATIVEVGTQQNDLTLDWLRAVNVLTSGTIEDNWDVFLTGVLAPPGALQDRQYAWLGGLGHTGALNDRFLQYWSSP